MRKGKNEELSDSRFKKANRGTNDELEIVSLIVANNPALRIAVLEKLRQAKRRVATRTTVKSVG